MAFGNRLLQLVRNERCDMDSRPYQCALTIEHATQRGVRELLGWAANLVVLNAVMGEEITDIDFYFRHIVFTRNITRDELMTALMPVIARIVPTPYLPETIEESGLPREFQMEVVAALKKLHMWPEATTD